MSVTERLLRAIPDRFFDITDILSLDAPDWSAPRNYHFRKWIDYVPVEIRGSWRELSRETRVAVYVMAMTMLEALGD